MIPRYFLKSPKAGFMNPILFTTPLLQLVFASFVFDDIINQQLKKTQTIFECKTKRFHTANI